MRRFILTAVLSLVAACGTNADSPPPPSDTGANATDTVADGADSVGDPGEADTDTGPDDGSPVADADEHDGRSDADEPDAAADGADDSLTDVIDIDDIDDRGDVFDAPDLEDATDGGDPDGVGDADTAPDSADAPADAGCAPGDRRVIVDRCSDDRFVNVECICAADTTWFCEPLDEACRDHSCDDDSELECAAERPECEGSDVIPAVIDGCWLCVDRFSCAEPLPPICEDIGGVCSVGPAGCGAGTVATTDAVCLSLGDCCVPEPSGCYARGGGCFPDALACPFGFREGPEEPGCSDAQRCCLPHDGRGICDDGTEWVCDLDPPLCDDFEVRAVQDGCAVCVNPATCLPWGESGCVETADCGDGERCDACGTSSCPFCEDCVSACVTDE